MKKPLATFSGKTSWFGGPDDTGVAPDEGLAFIYSYDEKPHLFLKEQPEGTTGLARRLDPQKHYVACRWDYDVTSKEMLAGDQYALVTARKTKKRTFAWPADWGPHESTGRAADVSPAVMRDLGIETDDDVIVTYPAIQRKEKRRAPVSKARKPSPTRRHVLGGAGKKHARHSKKSRR